MLSVRQLEQPVPLPERPLLVRDGREAGSEAGAESTIDLGSIDGDHGDSGVLALDLLLHRDEHAQPHLLLRAPPAAHEGEHERPVGRQVGEASLGTVVSGRAKSGKRLPTASSGLISLPSRPDAIRFVTEDEPV